MIALAAAAFVAIFFFNVPFPFIIIAAAIIGFTGDQMGSTAFQVGGGHGAGGQRGVSEAESALGDALPDHVQPTLAGSVRTAAIWLAIWFVPVFVIILALGVENAFSQIGIFFSKMAVVTFGGAYAVLAYVAQQAVEHYHWLRPGEMLDGLGMAETMPGPLIKVLQFVAFLGAYRDPSGLSPMVAGTLGGLLATWTTFVPCFLWIFFGAPFAEKLRDNKSLNAALSAITAAIVGVVLNLAVWFAVHAVFRETMPVRSFGLAFDAPKITSVDPWALVLAIAAAVAIFRFKIGMITTLGACCVAGMILYFLGAIS
jgi:chromate transporter